MNLNTITTLTAVLGRTPTEEELNKYEDINKKYISKSEELYNNYVNTLYEGYSQDKSVSVKVDYRFSAKEISAMKPMEQKALLLKIQEAFNNALDISSETYKNYLTKSQLLSGQFMDEIVKEFSQVESLSAPNKILN